MALPSVSRRLVVSVAVPMALFFGGTVFTLDRLYREVVQEALNQRLDEQMVALISAVDVDRRHHVDVRLLDPEYRWSTPISGYYAEVSAERGGVLWQSPSLTGANLALDRAVGQPPAWHSLLDSEAAGRVTVLSRRLHWEFPGGDSRELVFRVAETSVPMQQRLTRFRRQLAGWFSVMALMLLGVIGWLMRRALEPVRRLEAEIGAIESGGLEQLSREYPRELAGVARGLNALLVSERERIRRYRETLGNLAHGLKTPLAIMRATLAGGSDPRAALNTEVDRIAAIVDHQLKRAATGGGVTLGQAAVAVAPVVRGLCEALRKVHADRAVRFDLDVDADAGFLGDSEDLTEALGNLADNACKYGGGRVRIAAHIEALPGAPQRLVVAVEDDGPGIAEADRQRVLSRGVRNDEHEPGQGLGLAMVNETVGLYAGALSVGASASLGGAAFRLVLPGRRMTAAAP